MRLDSEETLNIYHISAPTALSIFNLCTEGDSSNKLLQKQTRQNRLLVSLQALSLQLS